MTLYGFSQKTAIFAKTFWRMRVLIINTSERIGGAAVAASRLMEALKNNGIKAKMLVRDKQTDQISVVGLDRSWLTLWKFVWERIVIWKANHFKKNNLFAVDRHRCYLPPGIPASRHYPPALDQSGNALTQKSQQNTGIGETYCMDYA